MNIPTNLEAYEVNTGGGCMVTIIKCPEWDYILTTTEECVAVYKNEDAFWEDQGDDALATAWVNHYPVNEFPNTPNVPQKREYIETDKLSGEPFPIESQYITHRDYDNHKFFNDVLAALKPLGAVNMSGHDDEYPSIGVCINKYRDIGVQMMISPKQNCTEIWRVSCFYYFGSEPALERDTDLISFDFDVEECVKMFNETLNLVKLRIEQDKEVTNE